MITRLTRTAVAVTLITGCVAAAQAEGLYVSGNLGSPDYHSNINGIVGEMSFGITAGF